MIFKQSEYLVVKDGYWRMFIRWAYHKYLDELYIPYGTRIRLGHGLKDISSEYNGYGKHITIYSTTSGIRMGNQEVTITSERIN